MRARLHDPGIAIFDRHSLERRVRQLLVAFQSEVDEIVDQGIISDPPHVLMWSREVVEPLAALIGLR